MDGREGFRRMWARLERLSPRRRTVLEVAVAAGVTLPWAFGHPVTPALAWPLVIAVVCMTMPSRASTWRTDWQAGTTAKHRARIARARAKEIEELVEEERARAAAFEAIAHRLEGGR